MDVRVSLFLKMLSKTSKLRLILLIALPCFLASLYISFELIGAETSLRRTKTIQIDRVFSRFIVLSTLDLLLSLSTSILQYFYIFYSETFIAHWLYQQIYVSESTRKAPDAIYTDFLLKKDAFVNMTSVLIFSYPPNIIRVVIRLFSLNKKHSSIAFSILIVILCYFICSYYAIRSRKRMRHNYNQKRLKKNAFCQLSFESYEILKSENISTDYADEFNSLSRDTAFSEFLFMVHSESYRLLTRGCFVVLKATVFGLKVLYPDIAFAEFLTSLDDLALTLLCLRNDSFMFFEYFYEAAFSKADLVEAEGEEFAFDIRIVLKQKAVNTIKVTDISVSDLDKISSCFKNKFSINQQDSRIRDSDDDHILSHKLSIHDTSHKKSQLSTKEVEQDENTTNSRNNEEKDPLECSSGECDNSISVLKESFLLVDSHTNEFDSGNKAVNGSLSDCALHDNQAVDSNKTLKKPLGLKHQEIVFPKGKKIFIWSSSSNGKTTVLEHLYGNSCTYWEVEVDGKPFHSFKHSSFCQKSSICLQDQIIFNKSILFNLAYGTSLDDKEIIEKLSFYGLDGFFEKFKEGLHTKIGNEGIVLSCGQRQLIHFYRTVMKDAEIYIFDEPALFLDRNKQQQIFKVIQNLKGTVVVVSKNLDFSWGFDFVYSLDQC